MNGYLGETIVDIKETSFKDFTSSDWALYFIGSYGQIDGAFHKQWVLDQVARILLGTPIILKIAKWDDGTQEYREDLGELSKKYIEWVEMIKGEFINGEYEYDYDEGIAP